MTKVIPKKNRPNLRNNTFETVEVGDLLHLPSDVQLWKWDEEQTVPAETKTTESPMVACYVENVSVGMRTIRIYCDGEYWVVKESDVFLLEEEKGKGNDY